MLIDLPHNASEERLAATREALAQDAPAMVFFFLRAPRSDMVAPDVDLAFAPASARHVVGALHPHEGIHLHAERFLDTKGHITREIGVERVGRETSRIFAAAVTVRPCPLMISVRIKSPGCGRFPMRMVVSFPF